MNPAELYKSMKSANEIWFDFPPDDVDKWFPFEQTTLVLKLKQSSSSQTLRFLRDILDLDNNLDFLITEDGIKLITKNEIKPEPQTEIKPEPQTETKPEPEKEDHSTAYIIVIMMLLFIILVLLATRG